MCNSRPSSYTQYALLLFAAALLSGCHKSYSEFDAGRKAEAIQDYDTALLHYESAERANPLDAEYKLRVVHMRYTAAAFHMEQGQQALQKGDLELAMSEFEKAHGIDPANVAAEQQMKKTADLLAVANGTQPPAVPDDFNSDEKELMSGPPQLEPLSREPINLKMTNDSRVVFETIAKLAGLCVIFDPDYVSRRVTAELPGVTLEQALDVLAPNPRFGTNQATLNKNNHDLPAVDVQNLYVNLALRLLTGCAAVIGAGIQTAKSE